ncbi:MAG TPA: hypothetical protein VG815_19655 [Chloroflexota bacterium]|jgi:hypothetical protein|nr:hypothetical protein [Chloroflexota bacterium]
MLGWGLAFLLVLVAFVVAIIWFASRSARRGRRYIGTDDPIERFEDRAESVSAFPWGNMVGGGGTGEGGWRWRVRRQEGERAMEAEAAHRDAKHHPSHGNTSDTGEGSQEDCDAGE